MNAEAWVALAVGLANLVALAFGFMHTWGRVQKKAGSDKAEIVAKLDAVSSEVSRQSVAAEKTADALWRRTEALGEQIKRHGEELATHRIRIEHLEKKRA